MIGGGRMTLVGTAVALAVAALGSSASAASYRSPGYKGTKSFSKITPPPLAPIALGTGKNPRLLVDRAGTAHVLYAVDGGESAADTLAFCNLQRGIKACASSGTAPNPQSPEPSAGGAFSGNFPAGNHDTDGPVPLESGNQLLVIDRRFPNLFRTPAGTNAQSNVFEWSSVDGGATITGPGQIGDNQMSGGAVAFGDPGVPSIGTISRTQTEGTFFQGSAAGQYTTAKAQLGTAEQAYDGSLALDGTRPVAAFADLSGTIFVREFSGSGDPNNVANWSTASFPGFSPRIVGGASGVFVLYSDSRINGGTLRLQRIESGAVSATPPVTIGSSTSPPAVSQDPTGRITVAYTDDLGVQVRSSDDGLEFTPPELAASIPSGQAIAALSTAATTDGGGFVAFVQNAVGAEAVGQVVLGPFGSQRATNLPGLGPLPGGGIGSAAGDELASSTCQTAKFGLVEAQITAGCFGHDPRNPNLDITLGELNLNGLRIIPDPGVRIGIDPKQHTIDTTGKVRIVLSAPGIDITLWHDELHAKLPTAEAGSDLFDLHELTKPIVAGFPIDGDVDIKLANGGVDIPISLSLPKYFGGVTGSATLHASTTDGLQLTSLEFKIADANLGALELKDVDISYTQSGNVWKGSGELLIPAGGGSLDAKLAIEFDDGAFKSGSLDVGLPYPGIPLDDSDPPPQLYLSHVGLGLQLDPLTLTGKAGLGVTPIKPPGAGTPEDYVFRLEGELEAAFGRPVTITVRAEGFLREISLATAVLTYRIPDQVTLNAMAQFRLGFLRFTGALSAVVDPRANVFGAQIEASAFFIAPDPFGDVEFSSFSVAVNNEGFAVYVGLPGITLPFPPFFFAGSVTYRWGDAAPKLFPYQDATSKFKAVLAGAGAAAARNHAHTAAATGFTVPAGAPTASLLVHGTDGPPQVALIGPDGQPVAIDNTSGAGEHAAALPDPVAKDTYVGIQHPRAGKWTVVEAAGSPYAIGSVDYSIGQPAPKVKATVSGKGFDRTLRYSATIPDDVAISFAEKTGKLLHVIGRARGKAGTIRFRPALGSPGPRQLIARITNDGLPLKDRRLGTFVVPKPPRPGRAGALRVQAGRRAFRYSFTAPANAARVLVRIVATDGRHLQRVVSARTRSGSVPVIGFRDGVTVTVTGLGRDGARGPAVSAKARRAT